MNIKCVYSFNPYYQPKEEGSTITQILQVRKQRQRQIKLCAQGHELLNRVRFQTQYFPQSAAHHHCTTLLPTERGLTAT